MASDSLDHPAYPISESGAESYRFVTEQGITYLIYFLEADGYAPSASFAGNLKMFGFERQPQPGAIQPLSEGSDPRIMVTVVEVLQRHFLQYSDLVVLYVCSEYSVLYRRQDSGVKERHPRFAKKRSELFASWFEQWLQQSSMAIEKIDYALYGVIYGSCLFRAHHPKEAEIRQLIADTIAEKQPTTE